jgi:hypothetical protein
MGQVKTFNFQPANFQSLKDLPETHSSLPDECQQQEEDRDDWENVYYGVKDGVSFWQFRQQQCSFHV